MGAGVKRKILFSASQVPKIKSGPKTVSQSTKRRFGRKWLLALAVMICFAHICPAKEGEFLYSLYEKGFFPEEGMELYLDGIRQLLESDKAEIERGFHYFPGDEIEPSEKGENCLMDIHSLTPYGDSDVYAHGIYEVEGGKTYFVTGGSASSYETFPLGAFFDQDDKIIYTFGLSANTVYEEEPLYAPEHAVKMVVNQNNGAVLSVKEAAYREEEINRNYNIYMADEMIRIKKMNPFCLAPLDRGYATFVFDDLTVDLDSVAAIFEEYGYPLVIAAIPSRLDETASGLKEEQGSYRPGMPMREIMRRIVDLGGEIMTHNGSPLVTEQSQYDHDFMFGYFIQAKKELEQAGFFPRGIIRAGGKDAVTRSNEIERWLVGSYDYSNMGMAPNYALERVSINRPVEEVMQDLRQAAQDRQWVRLMCHGYEFEQNGIRLSESGLREILDCCRENGIGVTTYAYMVDTFGSTELEERMKAQD